MPLYIELLNSGPMVNRANFILHVLQGNGLDDLVRESIQNALDASIDRADPDHKVCVDFTVNEMFNQQFAGIFDALTQRKLTEKFNNDQPYKLLAIRDTGTCGLTGEWDDENSNIYKLIRDIGRAQAAKGAGGAYGLGKTIFSFMGPGLVGYYTKTNEAGVQNKERLVFACIENELDTPTADRITDSRTGIAWWTADNGAPLSDSNSIHEILKMLGIKPFADNETGTVILIPYFGQTSTEIFPEQGQNTLTFETSEVLYIRNAIEKWYCNRLTRSPGKCMLRASVNGQQIKACQPVFQTIQQLKNLIHERKSEDIPREGLLFDYTTKGQAYDFSEIDKTSATTAFLKPIRINTYISDTAPVGWLAAVRTTRDVLRMDPPTNKYSPHKYIFGNNDNVDERSAILGMCRGFEMIVDYDDSGEWTNRLKADNEEENIIALFMLNSEARLVSNGTTLEEYIRSIEDPTHRNWSDKPAPSPRIAEAIKRNVRNALSDAFAKKAEVYTTSDAGEAMRAQFGKALLPDDFGTAGTSLTKKNSLPKDRTRVIRGTQPKLKIKYDDIEHKKEGIRIKLGISTSTSNHTQPLRLSVLADAGAQQYSLEKWAHDKDITGCFPFKITSLEIKNQKKKIRADVYDGHACFTFTEAGIEGFDVELSLETLDRTFKPILNLKTKDNKNSSDEQS